MKKQNAAVSAVLFAVVVTLLPAHTADAVNVNRNTKFKIAAKLSQKVVEVNTTFTLSGTLSPAKKGVVVRRDKLTTKGWVHVTSTKTDKKGQWKFNIKAPNAVGVLKYRLVTPLHRKTSAVIAAVRVVPPPDPVITVLPITTDMPAGSLISLIGSYENVGESIDITINQLVNDVWTPIQANATVGVLGWAARITLPMTPGTYTYQAVANTERGIASTPPVSVNVLPPLPNTIDALGPGTPSRIWGMDIARYQHMWDTNGDGVKDINDDGKPIDFALAFSKGMRFVFIKASDGYIDPSDGSKTADDYALKFASQDRPAAQTAGIYTGLYHFPAMPDSSNPAVLKADARQEAIQAAARLTKLGGYTSMDLPYVLDVEHADYGRGISRKANASEITLWVTTWVKEFQMRTGRMPIVYTGPNFLKNYFLPDPLWDVVPLWIAHYGCTPTVLSSGKTKCVTDTHAEAVAKLNAGRLPATGYDTVFHRDGNLRWHFWQYSSRASGKAFGIQNGAALDVNVFSGTSEQFMSLTQQLWQPLNEDDYQPVLTQTQLNASYESAPADEPVTFVVSANRIDNGSAALSGEIEVLNNGDKIPGIVISAAGLGLWNVTLPPAGIGSIWNLSINFTDTWSFYAGSQTELMVVTGSIA